jgi:hypothetical protein
LQQVGPVLEDAIGGDGPQMLEAAVFGAACDDGGLPGPDGEKSGGVKGKGEEVERDEDAGQGLFAVPEVVLKVLAVGQTVQPGAIVDNQRLSAVLEQVKAQQAAYPAHQQRGHAARQRPPNNLDAPGLPSKGRAPRGVAAPIPA